MTFAKFASSALAASLLLAACSQSDPPSDEIEEAAEELAGSLLDQPEAGGPELGTFAPRDECSELAGAHDFLAMLNGAIASRDTDVLVALAAEDVKLGFGGEDGVENLRLSLQSEGSTLWDELSELIHLGCAGNDQGGISMPWYFAQDTAGDPYFSYIVTSDAAPLHAEPREDSSRLAILNWDEVEVRMAEDGTMLVGGNPEVIEESWYGVRVAAARAEDDPAEGFIRANQLRSVIDYRLIAASRNGRWRITAMLAGD